MRSAASLLTKRTMLSPTLALLACAFILSTESGDGAEIIRGTEVKPHSLPAMALINVGDYMCGGTLIHPKWVLTAAHCAGKKISVTLGVHSRKSNLREKRVRQSRRVTRQVIHPRYNETFNFNDLMLLELQSPVKGTASVKWLNFNAMVTNPPRYPPGGQTCLVAGWGGTDYDAAPSDVLMSTNVTVIHLKTCSSENYYHYHPSINKDVICAGSAGKMQRGTWKGDSGGPLLCDRILVGVTSFGVPCLPGAFMYLSKDRVQWIQKTIG